MIFLYLKQHQKTGLKYFGRTTSRNPTKYKGSGTRWNYHCTKHGWEFVDTLEIWAFEDQEECTKFALQFSHENNIVESNDFANLEIEDGRNGRVKGAVPPYTRKPRRGPISERHAKQLACNHEMWRGRKHKPETIEKMKGPKTEEAKIKMSIAAKARVLPELTCPHCGKVGKGSGMHRFHFNFCKSK